MAVLDGAEAFKALTDMLGAPVAQADWTAASPAIERLRDALCDPADKASTKDLALLLRQALRFEAARRDYSTIPSLPLINMRLKAFTDWRSVGCDLSQGATSARVEARAWAPDWLTATALQGVDGYAASETVRRHFNGVEATGDPLLRSVGRQSYRSRGQRAAVRAALSTPEAGTLVVALPTGEGKSLIFQLAERLGFTGRPASDARGVTLVIVPTVALGLNHEQEAVEVCGLSKPLAFQGGAHAENAIIAGRIADGSQGLCFASPEAACAVLREPLREAAKAGWLKAIVVDEAHLVDQWGTGFRTEFQELSGLRRELLSLSPPGHRARTLLLSATLTDSSLETLRALFGTDGPFESLAAVKLRPEPDYWAAPMSDEDLRIARVLETLHHAPRPAVLYVTQVADAIGWHRRLSEAGFGRLGLVHGKTVRAERDKVVAAWRSGELDLVVGTSAFGLGIDYAHARTVVHACVPETLDRFYQEVGRAGRDGRAALSLIVPTFRDAKMAKRLMHQKMITIERALVRWTTMFRRKVSLPQDRFAVRIDGRPSDHEDDMDMQGPTNTDWNLRTLAMMARAGLIHLQGSPSPKLNSEGDWVEIDILDERHLEADVWLARVEPVRQASRQATTTNGDLMDIFLSNDTCPALILEDLYGSKRVGRECSRCALCRTDDAARRPTVSVGEPISPWTPEVTSALDGLCDSSGRLLVTYDRDTLSRAQSRRLGDGLERLRTMGVAKVIIMGEPPFEMSRVLSYADAAPVFISRLAVLAECRLPPGPEVVLVGPGVELVAANLTPRPGSPRILVTDRGQIAPDGRPLRDVFGGRVLTLEEFQSRLAQ